MKGNEEVAEFLSFITAVYGHNLPSSHYDELITFCLWNIEFRVSVTANVLRKNPSCVLCEAAGILNQCTRCSCM
jgi:hypothetical protein